STRQFLSDSNPAALREIASRLLEAQDRGLWHPRSNGTYAFLKRIASGRVAVGTAEDAAGGEGRGDGGERDRGDRDRGGDTSASRAGARDA
ncbi:MAG: cobaltochelatase subunit CobN, partial [Alphaproteobacteria bacterium]|nr:cobaltochelatase subunit CobN [Alphaproteobacteria bacterium]